MKTEPNVKIIISFVILNLFLFSSAFSQSLIVNAGGVYSGNGLLRIKGGASENSSGTISGIGTDASSRISGSVEWAKSQPGQQQNVQGLYYNNLKVSGGNKIMLDGIRVYGNYITTGHTNARTYQNIFYYDFDNPTGSPQTITIEPYNSLSLIDLGRKSIASGTVTILDRFIHSGGQFTVNNGAGLELGISAESQSSAAILNLGTISTGANSSAIFTITPTGALHNGSGADGGWFAVRAGSMIAQGAISQENSGSAFFIRNGGVLNSSENGIITVSEGSFIIESGGSLSAQKALNTAGTFIIASGAGLSMTGSNFTNTGAIAVGGSLTLSNTSAFILEGGSLSGNYSGVSGEMQFDGNFAISQTGALYLASSDRMSVGGLFSRTADQTVSLNTNSIFTYTGSAQQAILPNSGNFPSYGQLNFTGAGLKNVSSGAGNVLVSGNLSVAGADLQMNNNEIIVAGSAVYSDNAEVVGRFVREAGNLNTTSVFTFNNSNSQIKFSGNVPTRFSLNVQPQSSSNYTTPNITGFNSQTDVARKITAQFQLSGETQISYLKLGYKPSEITGLAGNEEDIRFVKGDGSSRGEKLIMSGVLKQNQATGGFRYVLLDNTAGSGGNIALVLTGSGSSNLASGNDILLTNYGYPVITRRDGRWSDPGAWDDGRVPRSEDEAEIQHLVYTGIDQPVYGITPYSADEADGSAQSAARLIRIIAPVGTKGSALIIGNKDGTIGASKLFRTALSGADSGIIIDNTALSTESESNIENFTLTAGRTIHGLWILGMTSNNYLPSLGASNIVNNGQFNNNGSVEIGE